MAKKINKEKLEPFLAIDWELLALEVKDRSSEPVGKDTLKHKMIYSYLLSLSRTFDAVYPEMETIAARLNIGSRQVAMRHIDDLETWGWIKRKNRAGTSNIYLIKPLKDVLNGDLFIPNETEALGNNSKSLEPQPEPVVITAEPAAMPTPEEGLSQYFLKYFDAGKLSKCLDFTAAMTEFKKLIDAERGTSVNIPQGFTEHLILNHPHVYDSWGIPF
ncbi:helix-turn-helix domain-containing protein [Erwinia typographi]|uniref:helix-turn-helix domain-containing protein n=1 Tax=Erwinia typographi TaxID=371042 RepID=UPI00068B5F7D|nr:helix-turn-helix domain-containing protein [Erwinia typographi]